MIRKTFKSNIENKTNNQNGVTMKRLINLTLLALLVASTQMFSADENNFNNSSDSAGSSTTTSSSSMAKNDFYLKYNEIYQDIQNNKKKEAKKKLGNLFIELFELKQKNLEIHELMLKIAQDLYNKTDKKRINLTKKEFDQFFHDAFKSHNIDAFHIISRAFFDIYRPIAKKLFSFTVNKNDDTFSHLLLETYSRLNNKDQHKNNELLKYTKRYQERAFKKNDGLASLQLIYLKALFLFDGPILNENEIKTCLNNIENIKNTQEHKKYFKFFPERKKYIDDFINQKKESDKIKPLMVKIETGCIKSMRDLAEHYLYKNQPELSCHYFKMAAKQNDILSIFDLIYTAKEFNQPIADRYINKAATVFAYYNYQKEKQDYQKMHLDRYMTIVKIYEEYRIKNYCESCKEYYTEPRYEHDQNDRLGRELENFLERQFKCEICNKNYKNLSALNYHEKTKSHLTQLFNHNGATDKQKAFAREKLAEIKRAEEQLHQQENSTTTSSSSSFASSSSSSSLSPENTANTTNDHVCLWNDCNKGFADAEQLNNHAKQHIANNRGTCQWKGCGKELKNLEAHIPQHTNYYPYECKHCDEKFKNFQSMNNHVRIQHPSKKYPETGKRSREASDEKATSVAKCRRQQNNTASSTQATQQPTTNNTENPIVATEDDSDATEPYNDVDPQANHEEQENEDDSEDDLFIVAPEVTTAQNNARKQLPKLPLQKQK